MTTSGSIGNRPAAQQIDNRTLDQVQQQAQSEEVKQTKGLTPTRDSFGLTATSPARDGSLSGSMSLPPVTGPKHDANAMEGKSMWLSDATDGALMFNELMVLAKLSQREMKDAKALKRAMHQGKVQAKGNAIDAEKAQQAAERDAAKEAFITSCCELVVVAAVSFTGSWMQSSGQSTLSDPNTKAGSADSKAASNKVAYGEAVGAISTSLGKVTSAAGSFYTKVHGAGRQADEKRLEAKRHEMVEAMFDDAIDEAKGHYEDAKEQFKAALRIMTEHFERQTQVIQKVTS